MIRGNDSGQCVTANNVKEEGILINNRDLFHRLSCNWGIVRAVKVMTACQALTLSPDYTVNMPADKYILTRGKNLCWPSHNSLEIV